MLPILLHHGIFGADRVKIGPLRWSYFGGGIEGAIASRGHAVRASRVSRTGNIQTRASQLKQILLSHLDQVGTPRGRAVILAHSMGGLDARYMIHKLGMARHVAALVTLSTPHRGSTYADWCLKNIDSSHKLQKFFRFINLDLIGVRDLTTDAMSRFNDNVPNHEDVAYFSVSASRPWHRVPPMLLHSHRIVSQYEGANDGVVSVKSATWGTHLETWPADHMHVVNRRMVLEIRNPTGNIRPRYLRLLDHLETCGLLSMDLAPRVR